MSTTRRALLGAGAALALPVWMSRAFASSSAPEEAELQDSALEGALERARAVGKPLLVIFTDPADERWEPGDMWGQLFALATRELWLDLALVEVVCLPRAAVGEERLASGSGATWGVLLETGGDPREPRPIEADLEPDAGSMLEASHEARVQARAAALAAAVRKTILPDAAARERRRAQAVATISETSMSDETFEDHGRLEAALEEGPIVRLVDLDRFAAVLRFSGVPERPELLARAARQRLFEQDPQGARWRTRSSWCPPCGMGRVPPVSRYFLEFYTR